MNYIKNHKMILECENISKEIYHEILKKRITDIHNLILGQHIWNQYSRKEWRQIWSNTFFSYC